MCLQNSTQQKLNKSGIQILDLYNWNIYGNTDLIDNCDYMDTDDCKTIVTHNSDPRVLQLNVRGILHKQTELLDLLRKCTYLESVDIVLLVETWLKKDNEHRINIPGYTYYRELRQNCKGGSVGFLVNNRLLFEKRQDLHMSNEEVENSFIEIKGKKQSIVMGVLYRLPNRNEKVFLKYYSELMTRIDKNKSLILGMDHNLDLLKHHTHKNTQHFLELQMDLKTFPSIMRPTRVTINSATLIDDIMFSLDLYDKQKNCILISDISDHLPCFSIITDCMPSGDETLKTLTRTITEKKLKCLKENVGKLNWDSMIDMDNLHKIDDGMEVLTFSIISELNKVSPEHYVPVSTKQTRTEGWMTNNLTRCSRKQLKLYTQALKSRNTEDYDKY